MGMIAQMFSLLFGGGRNVLAETAQVFRVNKEAEAIRISEAERAALAQFAAEFGGARGKGGFDRFMDGVNRLPRPAMVLGTFGLIATAMIDPVWFSARMQGLALVPEPLWWLLGAIVSFYFGARHQIKGQEFQRQIGGMMAQVPRTIENLSALEGLRQTEKRPPSAPEIANSPERGMGHKWRTGPNRALDDWISTR